MSELQYKQVAVESFLETDDVLTVVTKSPAPYDVEDKKNFEGLLQIHTSFAALLVIAEAYQA